MSKTVIINPELFKIGKTKKNKPKPLVTAKSIKQTLINRIKENQKKNKEKNYKGEMKHEGKHESEFQESEKFLNEILNQKNKTVKNYQPLNNYNGITPISKNTENILFKPYQKIKLNYKLDEHPHGCLKNGLKQCFRSYQKNHIQPMTPNVNVKPYNEKDIVKRIVESEINKAINGKIEFSADLVKKYEEKPLVILDDINLDVPLIDSISFEQVKPEINPEIKLQLNPEINTEINTEINVKDVPEISYTEIETNDTIETECPIQISRTIKRKYTLGKNRNKVGILMKGKKTKKNIIEYTKELRKLTNDEIKRKLREKGLIRVGSTAPPEIVRKIFENMELAGDITNEDKDVHLHNLINIRE